MHLVVIYGWNIKNYQKGFYANYCPICRCAQPFKLWESCEQFHLFFMPFTSKPVLNTASCVVCDWTCPVEENVMKSAVPRLPASVEDLAEKTNPSLFQVHKEALERGERIRKDPHCISEKERVSIMAEQLVHICGKLKPGKWNSPPSLCLIGIFLFAFAAGIMWFFMRLERLDMLKPWIIISGIASMASFIGYFLSGDRKLHETFFTRATHALEQLEPTAVELRKAFLQTSGCGANIIKHFDSEELHDYVSGQAD